MPDIIITPGSGLIDFYPSNKTASIYTSGNDLAFANPSGNFEFISGNVAIGTTTPSGNLHVIGTGLISSKLGVNTNSPSGSFDVAGDSYFRGATTGTVTTVYFKAPGFSDNTFKIRTDNSANLYIDAGAYLKLGNQDGRAELYSYTGPLYIGHLSNSNAGAYGGQYIRFMPANVESMRLTASGNLGIGTTVPSGKLSVIGSGFFGTINSSPNALLHAYSATSGDTVLNVEGTNGSLFSIVDSLSGTLMAVNNNAGLPVFEVFSDDSIVAGRFNQNDFVISSGGNVGMGTASPVSKLQVSGLITANSGNFTNSLQLNGTGVSISGHTHTGNDILLIVDGVNDTILTSGCTANLFLEQLNSNGLTEAMNVVGGALSETITNFNTSVSGLLPVKNIVAGTNVTVSSISGIYTINSTASGVGGGGGGGVVVENSGNDRILTSTGSSSGINAEANLTFNGSVLNVTGSGVFASGIRLGSSTVSGVIIGLSTTGTVPAFIFDTPATNHGFNQTLYDFRENGISLISIDGSGNVGINTRTPSGLLHLNSGDLYLGPSYGLRWLGGSRLYEQTVSAGGTERLLYQPNGDRFEILTEAGSEFIAGFHGSGSALSNSIRLHRPVGIGNNYAQSGSLPTNGLAVQGNVGIGVQSPSGNLHVIGTGIFSSRLGVATNSPVTAGHIFGTLTVDGSGQSANLYSEGIRIGAASNGYAIVTFGANTANPSGTQANQWWIGKDGRDNGFNIFVSGAGSDSFHITTGGNVGIRTISPTAQLHVNGSGFIASGLSVSGFLQLNGTGVSISGHTHTASQVGAISGVGASGYLARWTASSGISSGILYDNGSVVGIRTIAPTAQLHVNGSGYFASGCSVSGILNVQVIKQPVASGTDGATVTFDMNTANVHTVRLGGNRTLAVTNVDIGQRFTIRLKQDTSPPRTVTWFSGIYWPSNKPPILTRSANAVDVFSFICTASGKYDGYIVGYNFPNA